MRTVSLTCEPAARSALRRTTVTDQGFAEWVRDHAMTIDSLAPQAPTSDLEPVREVIRDAQVVAIGENAHHVREFYLLRHRLLRFLVERCGFTVYAFEASFTEAHAIDDWVQGGPGTVKEVAAAGASAGGLGECQEMYDLLTWMREHNQTSAPRLRFAGTIVASRLPALEKVAAYLRWADPDALPLLEQIINLSRTFHHSSAFKAFQRYTLLDPATQDSLTAGVSRLLARMETMSGYQRSQRRGQQHSAALHHLRGVWHGDHSLRDIAGRGIPVGSASTDAFLAESVLRLLREGTADTRIVLTVHNTHIRKTPIAHEGAFGLFPAGYHLAQELGENYVAIAATSNSGRTARVVPDPQHPRGFVVREFPQPPLVDGSVEAAFTAHAPALVDLRAARPFVCDADSFQRMRMENYITDVEVFDAYDAIVNIPHTSCTDYAEQPPSQGS